VSWSFRSKFRSIEIVNGPAFWPTVGWVGLAVFAQAVLAPWLIVRHAIPSFVTIAVVLYASRVGTRRGAVLGLIAGVLTDATAGTGGGWTLADTAVGLIVGAASGRIFADSVLSSALLVGGAVILRDAIFWIVMSAEGFPRGYGTAHLHASLWQAALTAIYALAYVMLRNRVGGDTTRIERYT
jgi:rod shape-determining protein MreD